MVSTVITINNVVLICLGCWLCFSSAVTAVSAGQRHLCFHPSIPLAQNSDLIINRMKTDEAAVHPDKACHAKSRLDEKYGRVCVLFVHLFIPMLLLRLPAMVRPLPPVEPVRVSRSKEPSLHTRPGVDAWHTALQQVRCMSAALPAAVEPETSLCCSATALMTSLMPPSSPTCWWTPVATVNICRQVGFGVPAFPRPAWSPQTCPHSRSFPGIFTSTCNVDVRWFPFDIQRCELKFGSWTFDGWLLDIQMKEADVSGYMHNGEWDLLGETDDSGTEGVLWDTDKY